MPPPSSPHRRRLRQLAQHIHQQATDGVTVSAAPSSAPAPAAADDLYAAVDRHARQMVERGAAGGMAIGISTAGGRGSFSQGWGEIEPVASRTPRPAAADTIFLVASLTKPVTALAVMQLIEQRKLGLDQPICEVVPEFGHGIWRNVLFGTRRRKITVRHLLTHTSGLPDAFPGNLELRERHAPLSDFVKGVCDEAEVAFEPGTDISYQSTGLLLLGEAVRRLSGLPLPEYLKEHVFGPCGMHDTTLGIAADRKKDREAMVDLSDETEYMAVSLAPTHYACFPALTTAWCPPAMPPCLGEQCVGRTNGLGLELGLLARAGSAMGWADYHRGRHEHAAPGHASRWDNPGQWGPAGRAATNPERGVDHGDARVPNAHRLIAGPGGLWCTAGPAGGVGTASVGADGCGLGGNASVGLGAGMAVQSG